MSGCFKLYLHVDASFLGTLKISAIFCKPEEQIKLIFESNINDIFKVDMHCFSTYLCYHLNNNTDICSSRKKG